MMKRWKFYLVLIGNALLRRKARMLIALLAVAVGATIISGMVTVYREVPEQMGRAFRAYGANLLLLPSGDAQTFKVSDLEAAETALSSYEVVGVVPYLYENIMVNQQTVLAGGTDFAALAQVSPYWQVDGRYPAPGEKELLLGREFAKTLRAQPGDTVTVTGGEGEIKADYTVSGIVSTGGKEEGLVFLNLSHLQRIKGLEGRVSLAQASVVAGEDALAGIEQDIRAAAPAVAPERVKQIASSEGTVLGKLQALVLLVTVVVLVLTLICVTTTMMAVVTERRREIGLKKALGADNRNIILEFLGEGCLLGFFGGILGTVLGYLFAQSVSLHVFSRPIVFAPSIAVFTLVLSILITGAASLVPVRIATRVDPAIVLRGE